MSIIHLDITETDIAIRKLRSSADALFDSADRIYTFLANVDWIGQNRDDFLYDLHSCTSKIKVLSDSLDLLSFQLVQELDQWEQNASHFSP
jgi:hypothetical protein